jgi:WD40 repeat protein
VGKKIIVFIVVVLVAISGLLGYFLSQGRTTMLTDPWKAISPDAAIVIEAVDLQNFISSLSADKGMIGEVSRVKEFKSFISKIRFLSGLLGKPGYKRLLSGNSAIISFHLSSGGKLKPLLSMAIPSDIRPRQIKEMLRLSGIQTIGEKPFHGNTLFVIPYILDDQKDTVWVSGVQGLLLCSSSGSVIRKAILQTGSESDIRSSSGFTRVLQASGKNVDRIFVVFGNMKGLLKPFFNEDSGFIADKINKLAECTEEDIYLNSNGIVLTGYTEAAGPEESLYKYKSGNPGLLKTYKILPAATVLFETVLANNIPTEVKSTGQALSKASELANKLREFTGDEITKAYIDIKDQPVKDNSLIIYRLKNRENAEKIFLDEFAPTITKDNVIFFTPDDVVKVPVYATPYCGFASEIIPGFAPGFDDSFFAFYDNYLVTGSSYATISRLLYDNLLNKTLANDLTYRDFDSTLPSVAGYFFYCVPSRVIEYLTGTFNESITNGLQSNRTSLAKIQAVGFRLTSSNNMLYNSLSIKFKEEAREESNTEWETLLDTVAAIKPFFFTNHITGAKEIFIQDLNNNAYLVNAAGRVLWKVPLRERITGAVYMIDFYRNGKYQILFSGKNYLHLLDRNGNYVERYPVKLRSPATNSLTLFDYDNNLNYRLLIAGEDKMVYAYDKNGNTVKGWTPFRTNGTVTSEICWFRVSGKDYIVVSDEASLYFIDRQGNRRLSLKEPVTRARNSAIRLTPGRDPSVVCSSPDGTIQHIYFDGSVKKFDILKLSSDHSFDIFDVNGDGFGEYVFIDAGILYLYNHNRTAIFKRDFGSKDLGGPISFIFSASDRKIGVFDIDKSLIYIINGEGVTMNGFPLKGASMFSVGKLSDNSGWHLIVGGTDRFLYNYKLNTEAN